MAKPHASTAAPCPTCGKIISRKSDLPRHMKTHAANRKELEYACPYIGCDFSTLQKCNLKTHLNTHTGERPHKCPSQGCEFSSPDPASLNRHRRNLHGHQAKGDSGSHAPARTRKTTRQRRKISPYPTSSSSRGSAEPSDPISNTYHSPPAPLPRIPEGSPCSSLLLAADDYVEGSKHTSAAYGTELITRHPQVNLNHAEISFAEDAPLLTSDSGVSSGSEAPMGELSKLLKPEQEGLHAVDTTAQPVFDVTGSLAHLTPRPW
ncbi:hypothetical protein OG21DRAFT_925475 [Imleria badia]|nr:hypothetical protein OG21DRAFT_925475 [Imleria badia]